MGDFFSEIAPLDFVQVTAVFLLTMLVFFGVKERRHRWLNYLLLGLFLLQWVFIIAFREQLATKLFATLMLLTAVVVESVVRRRGRLGGAGGPV